MPKCRCLLLCSIFCTPVNGFWERVVLKASTTIKPVLHGRGFPQLISTQQMSLHDFFLLGFWNRLSCSFERAEPSKQFCHQQTAVVDWPVDWHHWMSHGDTCKLLKCHFQSDHWVYELLRWRAANHRLFCGWMMRCKPFYQFCQTST